MTRVAERGNPGRLSPLWAPSRGGAARWGYSQGVVYAPRCTGEDEQGLRRGECRGRPSRPLRNSPGGVGPSQEASAQADRVRSVAQEAPAVGSAASDDSVKTTGDPRQGPRPLAGVRVLAIENFVAGPYGSMLLADFGAEVIKVEPPETGDGYRHVGIIRERDGQHASSGFLRVNRNKRSVALNLQAPEGKDLFRRLARQADVVWENLRPGVMDRLGLGYRVLAEDNPRLVYASVSGFGHTDIYQSPYTQMPAFDSLAQAMSGIVYRPGREGDPPVFLGFALSDTYSGVLAAFGVVLALQTRAITGRGQHVDVSMYDALLTLNEHAITDYAAGEPITRGGAPASAPFGLFRVADGYISIGVVGQPIWQRFCAAIERPDLLSDERLRDGADRSRRQEDVLRPIIEAWGATRTRAEAVALLSSAGVPAAPVQTVDDILACPHVRERRMLLRIDDPIFGALDVVGNPIKFSDVPEVTADTPPSLGADTAHLLGSLLGIGDDELARLRAAGIVG
ncbi:MAG: CoA transferase [Chloroflexi bacterium]|nr:CoA transferase [Chloroflexota bacterium]